MSALSDVISYIHNQYPDSQTNLSVERLIKLLYLSDWKYAISYDSNAQITTVAWHIRDFQPWMDDQSVHELVDTLAKIRVGKPLEVTEELIEQQKQAINFVIENAHEKSEVELSRLVHSTFPAIKQNNSSNPLDFHQLAEEYKLEFRPFLAK